MLARIDERPSLVQAFSAIEAAITEGRLAGYKLYAENGSDSTILYATGARNSMTPVAVRCGDSISQMPPQHDAQGDIAWHSEETLKFKLADIASKIAFTPA